MIVMFLLQELLFISVFFGGICCVESTRHYKDEMDKGLLTMVKVNWPNNPAKAIANSIQLLYSQVESNVNITLIGSQLVHDEENNIIGVKQIELVFPKPKPNVVYKSQLDKISSIQRGMTDIRDSTGIDISLFSCKRFGDNNAIYFLNRELEYRRVGSGVPEINITTVTDKIGITEKLKQFKGFSPTIVHLDVDNKFVEEGSVFPDFNGFTTLVDTNLDPPEKMLKNALMGIGKAVWQNPKNLHEALVKYLEKQHPDYTFIAFNDDADYHIDVYYRFTVTHKFQNIPNIRILANQK